MTPPELMDRTEEHEFTIAIFPCVAKYLPDWDQIELEVRVGIGEDTVLLCKFRCGPNLTLTQVQEYAAQKVIGELIYHLAIAKDYADARWGKK